VTDEDFALPGSDISPRDQINRDTWEALTTLPTDVAIRTSDYDGTRIKNLYLLCRLWQEAIASPNLGDVWEPDMVFGPMLTAMEEFDAGEHKKPGA
jgi:hypothetical protein